MKKMWESRNLPGEVIDVTINCIDLVDKGICEFYDNVDRGYEIQYWLDNNEFSTYVIIDDIDMVTDYNNFIKTSKNLDHPDSVSGYGLTEHCAKNAIKILNEKEKITI